MTSFRDKITPEHRKAIQSANRALISFNRVWLATFVAAGLYGVVWAGIMALLIGGAIFGAVTVDVLWSSVAAVLAFIVLGALSVFIVPLLTKSLVRSIARARVGFAWTCVSVVVGWTIVTAASTLLWLIPGAQPFAALLVWAGATAVTAYLLVKRSTPLVKTVKPTGTVGSNTSPSLAPVSADTPHLHH